MANKYIWQHSTWPNLQWDEQALASLVTQCRKKQHFLLGAVSVLGFDLRLQAQGIILEKEVIETSAIEGEQLDPEGVRSSVANKLGLATAGSRPADRKTDATVEVLLDAGKHFNTALSQERLKGWYAALFPDRYSGFHRIVTGNWRQQEMEIVSGPEGRQQVHYKAPPPEAVPKEIRSFLHWLNDQNSSPSAIDGLIRAGLAHYRFVAILLFPRSGKSYQKGYHQVLGRQREKHQIRPYLGALRTGPCYGGKMNQTSQQTSQQFTRMSGTDQVVWNLVGDLDLFCIWAIASLAEPLQDALLEQSLKYLLQTIPILNTQPVTTWFSGKWQFLEKEDVGELISRVQAASNAEAEEQLQQVYCNPINAKDAAMIRLYSIDGPEKHYFVIQVHHLVVDGEGLKRICAQFAEIYRALYRDPSWQPDQILDPCRSLGQILRQVTRSRLFTALPAYLISLIRQLAKTAPALRQRKKAGYRLINTANTDNDPALASLSPFFSTIVLEQEVMLKAKAFTQHQNVTVHDLLMTSFSLAIMAWNTERGDERNWLRFFYTANLRRWWGEPSGTFCNFSAILNHEEVFHNLQSPSLALAATKAQLDQAKKIIGLDSFLVTVLLPALPYFLLRRISLSHKEKLFTFTRQNQAMTNIGIISEQAGDFGHTKAEGYSLLAPTIAGGCLLFTISTYKNVMTLYLGCTEDGLNKEDAQAFLCLWKEKFLQVIAG